MLRHLLGSLLLLAALGCDRAPSSQRQATSAAEAAPAPSAAASSTASSPPAPIAKAAAPSPTPGATLTLLTYNVLATPLYRDLRIPAVLAILERSQADVIALQEVAPWMLQPLLAAPWAKGYEVTRRDGQPFAPGGQLILSRHPIVDQGAAVLPGRQRRTVLWAAIAMHGRTLGVATTHMESFLRDGPTRARQLQLLFPLVHRFDDGVLLGDLNFGDGELLETTMLDPAYADSWLLVHPSDPGFTWHNEDNPIAGIGAFVGEPNRRLDRILLRSPGWRPDTVTLIGNRSAGRRPLTGEDRAMIAMPERPVPGGPAPTIEVFPSDHYGLLATYHWSDEPPTANP